MRSSFLESLGKRTLPHFGQLSLLLLLFCAVPLCLYFETHHGGIHPRSHERAGPATLISWLPDAVLLSHEVMLACGVVFLGCGVLWLLRRGLPWSSWGAAFAFLAILMLYVENASQVTHVAHLTAQLLIIHALWYHFSSREIRAADREGRFWRTSLYPHWVHFLSVFAIGTFYGWSGLSKLLQSGVGWANGVPLQLWTNLWGLPSSFGAPLILADRRIAALLQGLTLVGETSGFLAVLSRRVRPWVGLLLIGFHIGQIDVFGWGFHANMVMLALFFLPVEPLVNRWAQRREARAALRLSQPDGAC